MEQWLIENIHEDTALVIFDLEGDFRVAVEYTRKIRLGGFAGKLLFLSCAEKAQQKIAEKIRAAKVLLHLLRSLRLSADIEKL